MCLALTTFPPLSRKCNFYLRRGGLSPAMDPSPWRVLEFIKKSLKKTIPEKRAQRVAKGGLGTPKITRKTTKNTLKPLSRKPSGKGPSRCQKVWLHDFHYSHRPRKYSPKAPKCLPKAAQSLTKDNLERIQTKISTNNTQKMTKVVPGHPEMNQTS